MWVTLPVWPEISYAAVVMWHLRGGGTAGPKLVLMHLDGSLCCQLWDLSSPEFQDLRNAISTMVYKPKHVMRPARIQEVKKQTFRFGE